MIRRIQTSILIVGMVFAGGAIMSSVASAEIALWLANGADITKELDAHIIDSLLELTDLEAMGGAVRVSCEDIPDGWVGPEGKGAITKILTSSGVEDTGGLIECQLVSGTEGLCETSMTTDVILLSLPLSFQLELTSVGTGYLSIELPSVSGDLGYMIICLTLLGETLDECKQASVVQSLSNIAAGVLGSSVEENTGACVLSDKNSGDITDSGILSLTDGEELTVSMP
jgi:hypothetical protein